MYPACQLIKILIRNCQARSNPFVPVNLSGIKHSCYNKIMIELMILYVLSKRELTMYSVQKFIFENFGAFSKPSIGAIKPALVRLEKQECLTSRKMMSNGGKLSVFYAITKYGLEELRRLILEKLSENPLQFFSNARVKLSCASFLSKDECADLFFHIKSLAMQHKFNAEAAINDEYNHLSFYQRIILDNTICEYANFITILEGLEKENAGSSK